MVVWAERDCRQATYETPQQGLGSSVSIFVEGVNDDVDSCPVVSFLGGLVVLLSCVNVHYVLVWAFVAVGKFRRWRQKKSEETKKREKIRHSKKHLIFVHSHFMSNRNRSPPVCFIF